MILLPGSFSGKISSPRPERGPEPRKRISFAIFIRLQAEVFMAPLSSTKASWAARASNLFGAVTKGKPKEKENLLSQQVKLNDFPILIREIGSSVYKNQKQTKKFTSKKCLRLKLCLHFFKKSRRSRKNLVIRMVIRMKTKYKTVEEKHDPPADTCISRLTTWVKT